MNDQQINILKELVQTSTILSSSEKNEWVALLGLMDDRQLTELYKILSDAKANEQKNKPQPKPVNLEPEAPRLTHILNMPRFGQDGAYLKNPVLPTPPSEIKKPDTLPVQKTSEKKLGFIQRLKNILAEKELPAPKVGPILEITAPHLAKKPEPVTFGLKTISRPSDVKKPLNPPVVPIPKNKPLNPPAIKKPLDNFPTKSNAMPISNLAQIKASLIKPSNLNTQSGISFGKSSNSDKEKLISEIKKGLEQKEANPALQVSLNAKNVSILSGNLQLDTLEDLEGHLTPNIFGVEELSSLVRKIKNLVAAKGYHSVIFNVEKSSLYKAYIRTGAEILNNQMSFDAMANKDGNEYLTRESFEECADLLRQIQA
jgi:hypothetical protein